MSEIEPRREGVPAAMEQGLQQFEDALTDYMGRLGLPSDGVMVTFSERGRVLRNFADAIERLDDDHRARSLYLSKFIAAVGAGLFDAALNYLWDETVGELRRRIAGYDLAYFFEIAVQDPERRKKLRTEEDLQKIDDFDLVRAANEIGLVSDIGFKQLDLIRYMRNFASAAHPNQNELTGMQLLGWLEVCIVHVVTLPESFVVAETKRLLANVKSVKLTEEQARETAEFFDDLAAEQADNLAAGLFGIYVHADTNVETRANVRLLFPLLWPHVSEDQRQQFGLKYARYIANADNAQAELARELLDAVEGVAYLPESVRSAEIASAVEDLLHAHRGFDNFYAEPSRARMLATLVGDQGVPETVRRPYVLGVVEAFLTNGHGVAWNAQPVYESLIDGFSPREAEVALLSFLDSNISSRLERSIPQQKFLQLLDRIEPKLVRSKYQEIAAAVREFSGPLGRMGDDSQMKRMIKTLAN